jgi:IclR family pca regulon transcriptional regulator
MPDTAIDDDDRDFVGSLARGLSVIRAFGHDAPRMTLSEVAARTGLTRAAARRFLLTLQSLGYILKEDNRFELTPRVLDLGFAYLSSRDLWEVATPYMEQVTERTRESCSASVLDGDDIVYVARVPTKRIMSIGLNVGARLPAFATSMGRVLMAALPPAALDAMLGRVEMPQLTVRTQTDRQRLAATIDIVRQQGFAVVDEELEEGLRSIAVPIRNKAGQVLAAMNVSGHASRTSVESLIRHTLPVLQDAAAAIRTALP